MRPIGGSAFVPAHRGAPGLTPAGAEALAGRLQAARMVASRLVTVVAAPEATASDAVAAFTQVEAARLSGAVREAAAALAPKDPKVQAALVENDGVKLAQALAAAAAAVAATLPPDFLEPLLARGSLSDEDVAVLERLNGALCAEYAMRREMLIRRTDCTLDALLTSARTASAARRAEAMRAVAPERAAMHPEAGVVTDDVFRVCTAHLASLARKTSCASERHAQASVKRVLMGAVPDRGGRTADAVGGDMPAWKPRAEGGDGGRGGGGGRGGRGGRGGGACNKCGMEGHFARDCPAGGAGRGGGAKAGGAVTSETLAAEAKGGGAAEPPKKSGARNVPARW